MTTNTLQWIEATEAVERAASILIVAHIAPDGDAIGTLLGLANALAERGKKVKAVVDGGVPASLAFMPGAEAVLSALDSGEWDLMISVDSSDERRTGPAGEYGRTHSKQVVNLDHHPTNTFFGDIFLVMPEAVSASEIVFHWLSHMGHAITRQVAVPLLTGLVTDTLGFRTSSVTSSTLSIAQTLMDAGASLTEITARTLDSRPYSTVDLWKSVLPTVNLDGAVISAVIRQHDLQRAGLDETSNGGLAGFLVTVNEAMIAVVFTETPEGQVEVSFRSKPGFDVAQVAFSLGGGGHKQASGATIDGPLEEAQNRVMPMLHEAARQGTLAIV